MELVSMIGNAWMSTPYTVKLIQPHVLSHLNLMSLFTNKEMANSNEARYPINGTIVSAMFVKKITQANKK